MSNSDFFNLLASYMPTYFWAEHVGKRNKVAQASGYSGKPVLRQWEACLTSVRNLSYYIGTGFPLWWKAC